MSEILTVTGTVAPVVTNTPNGTYGIDYGGYFGPAGASLAGDPYTVVWTASDCGAFCLNPVINAVLTINGHSYDFGSGSNSIFRPNDPLDPFEQVQQLSGVFLSLTTRQQSQILPVDNPAGGVFYIPSTQAFLTVDPAPLPVPGPIVGTGPSSLVLLAAFIRIAKWRSFRSSRSRLGRWLCHLRPKSLAWRWIPFAKG